MRLFHRQRGIWGVTLSGYGAYDICVTCLDPQGNWLWAAQAGGTGQDHGYRLAVDDAGNSYVTGKFSGTATFGTQTISSLTPGYPDVFVAKLDPDGDWLWVVRAGGADSDSGYGICVRSSGVSITGTFSGSASFGSFNLSSGGEMDIFAAKTGPSGNWLWAKRAGGSSADYGKSITTDSGGTSYITGEFRNTASFDAWSVTSSGGHDIFIGKLSPGGVPLDDELAPQTSSPSQLGEAYPNPFRRDGFTCITAYVAKCEVGTLTIFNLRGEALLSRNLSPGMHEVLLSGRDLPSGLYFCRLNAGAAHSVKKVVLLK
jgi:hypothetical protein